MKYLHEKSHVDAREEALGLLHAYDHDIDVFDVTDWTQEKRKEIYESELFPLSIKRGKKLRGRVRTHKAGHITFTRGVLVASDDFFVGNEAVDVIRNHVE